MLFGALALLSAGLLLRGALPGTMLFPGTIVACGAIAVMNVLLSSMIKRRAPAQAGLFIGVYLTSLSVGAVIASLISVPLYNATGGSVPVTLGLWGLPAVAATLIWITQLRYHRATPARCPRKDRPCGTGPACTGTRWRGRSPPSWACRACSSTRPCPGCRNCSATGASAPRRLVPCWP